MAWHLIRSGEDGAEQGSALKEFLLDSADDISNEPTEFGSIAIGSTAHTTGNEHSWEKGASGWEEIVTRGGGGGGAVDDVKINGTSIVDGEGIANIPVAGTSAAAAGVTWAFAGSKGILVSGDGELSTMTATDKNIKEGTNSYRPITASNQHKSAFYGLARAAGDSTQSASSNAVGTYTADAKSAIRTMLDVPSNSDIPNDYVQDIQVGGDSIVEYGVANIPWAGQSARGVVKFDPSYGIDVSDYAEPMIVAADSYTIQTGYDDYLPIVPSHQHEAAFYGLAAAAGDSTQSASANAVGTYTETAKSAINSMLSAPETISGTTPTIAAKAGVQYICGEVSTIDFTPSASGVCDVVFTSGSTPAVLTVPNTVKFPSWFDPDNLDADTTYEINVLNGVYGAVMAWA